jgi:branched-chain amino acid transport system ATP-binding protein
MVALLGPNGAGKTTTLKTICGLLTEENGDIKAGDVLFEDKSIVGIPSYELVHKGIALVPEGRRIFMPLSVRENLLMGAYIRRNKSDIALAIDRVFLLFPILKERQKQVAGTLSSGEQQMLSVGRALMIDPKMLLLDEPSLGLSPNYIDIVFEKIKSINSGGTTILFVEQNAQKALAYADRAYVFDIGKIRLSDKCESLLKNDIVKDLLFL